MARWGDLRFGNLFPALKQMGFWDLTFGRGHFENCIRPFETDQTCVQMSPNGIRDISQPIKNQMAFRGGRQIMVGSRLT